jgi:hypothetical protein
MSAKNNRAGNNNNRAAMNVTNNSNSNASRYKRLPGLKRIKEMYIDNEERYQSYQPHEWKKKSENRKYDSLMSEIHLHLYLIYSGYRNVAEIKIHEVPGAQLNRVCVYLNENGINFGITHFEPRNPSVNGFLKLCVPGRRGSCINDPSRGKAVAEELGEFYTCQAELDKWKDYQWRIVITCDSSIDLFAQMCPKEKIIDGMKTVTKVYEDLSALFIALDEKRFEAFPVNPLKISIYKVYKKKAGAAGGNN